MGINHDQGILPIFVREICTYSMPRLPLAHPRCQRCGCRYWPCLLASCTPTNQSFDVSVDSFPQHLTSCDFFHLHHAGCATCSSCRSASRSGAGIRTCNPQKRQSSSAVNSHLLFQNGQIRSSSISLGQPDLTKVTTFGSTASRRVASFKSCAKTGMLSNFNEQML